MKIEKDVILAIIIGIILGNLAAFFLLVLPKYFPKPPSSSQKEEMITEKKTTPPPQPLEALTVTAPKDETISAEEKITISGKTNPQTLITIVSAVDEVVTEADDQGSFEAEILLEEGANEISVTSYHDSAEETELLTVYYTEEKIE